MKLHYALSALCIVLVLGCGKKDEEQQKAQTDQVATSQNTNGDKDKYYDEVMQDINNVYADLEATHAKESKLLERMGEGQMSSGDAREKLNEIGVALRQNRQRIAELQTKMKSFRGDISELQATVARLKQALRDRERTIANLENRTPDQSTAERHRIPMSYEAFDQKLHVLAADLQGNDASRQKAAAQSVLDLKEEYPDRSYAVVVIPLMGVVKNEKADGDARMTAARALHELHSERGDYAIKGVSEYSNDRQLKLLCTTLAAERDEQLQMARVEKKQLESQTVARR